MEPSNNTETEDETIALKKKRARRVSFVENEITSVHIFRRDDEDSESPLDSKPISSAEGKNPKNDVLGFFRDLGGDSDEDDLKESSPSRNAGGDGDADDGEAVDVRKSFLKPVGSPSPGSSTAGSAASTDDEDEFHGPVSASFIRPGQLSDSAASDDNHDLTMDSTAFSMHYRSLAWSDSGDLKTPTRFGIPFEEKTPSQTSGPTAPGSFMEFTRVKKQSPQPLVPADAASASRDSNDMTIVGENRHSYDYDRLSPSIDAILAEGSKDLPAVSQLDSTASDLSQQIEASITCQNRNGYLIVKSPEDSEMGDTAKHDMSVKVFSMVPCTLVEINKCSMSPLVDQVTNDYLFNKGYDRVADASIHKIRTPDCAIKEIKEFVADAIEPDEKQLEFAAANGETKPIVDVSYPLEVSARHDPGCYYSSEVQVKEINPNHTGHVSGIDNKFDQVYGNLIRGSTPLSVAGTKQLLIDSPDSSRHTGAITPPSKLPLLKEYVTHGETLSSIRKSISKLKTLGTSPSTYSLKKGIDGLKLRLSKYSTGSTLFSEKDCEYQHISTLNAPLEDQLISVTPKIEGHQNLVNMDDHKAESLRNIGRLSQNEEIVDPKMDGERFHCIAANISYDGKIPKPVEMTASSSQMVHSTAKMLDFDLADSTVENIKNENASVIRTKCVSSLIELLDQKLSPSLDNQNNCCSKLKQLDQDNESVIGLGHPSECSSQTAVAKQLDLSLSGDRKKSSSPFEVALVNKFSETESKRKSADSPAKSVLALSAYGENTIQSPIQEASILLPSMQELPSVSLHHNRQNLSSKGNLDGPVDDNYHQALQAAQSPFPKFCMEICSGKKRKGIELLREGNNIDRIGRTGRSPKVHKSCNSDLKIILGQSDDARSDREKLGDQTWNNCVDILNKFLGCTKELLFPSVDKLTLTMIGMLEDILVHLWKVKKCEILCSEIHSQLKVTDPLSILRNKRVVETRMLLYNIASEKAKVQLMNMKHERLLKKVQQLSYGLQESQILKLNCTHFSSKIVATETPAKESHFQSGLPYSEGKCQVSCNKVTTMRQELETLDRQAKSLSKFLHSKCKLEGDKSCAGTISLVQSYMKQRLSYKCIFQNLQLWEIDNFECKGGCYRVLLHYCGYIIQRFIANTGSPSIIISNKLNDQKIVKSFPDMDAFAAFVFVLNPDTTKTCTGSRGLAQETQITSSLLSNLLDVIEEVQLARIKIRNLVVAKFYSQSVGQLDLLLSFIDFYTGRKLKVILDMSCLKCGTYPVDILPSHTYGEPKSLSMSLVAEIRTAAESVRVGYSRIMRLCRCVSQAVQACTPSR